MIPVNILQLFTKLHMQSVSEQEMKENVGHETERWACTSPYNVICTPKASAAAACAYSQETQQYRGNMECGMTADEERGMVLQTEAC